MENPTSPIHTESDEKQEQISNAIKDTLECGSADQCNDAPKSNKLETKEILPENGNINIASESRTNVFATDVEDEDVVLGEDDAAKDFDGNIDEDELLKDTDADDCRANLEKVAMVESQSKKANKVPLENVENDLDNQNSNEVQNLNTESEKELPVLCEKNDNNSVETVTSSSDKSNETKDKTETDCIDKLAAESEKIPSNIMPSETEEINNEAGSVNESLNETRDESEISKNVTENDSNISTNESIENMASSTEFENITNTTEDKNDDLEEKDTSTKFLHVDQDNSHPEECYDMMDAGGEDPFAQTSDYDVNMTEHSGKDSELEKSQLESTTNELMDVDDIPQNDDETKQHTQNNKINDLNENTNEVGSLVFSEDCTNSTNLHSSPTLNVETSQTTVNDINQVNHSKETQGESNLETNKMSNIEVCIVPDKVSKQSQASNQEKNTPVESFITNSSKPKVNKTPKSKSKSKKDSSDDSSSDSDFVIKQKTNSRPKRNAAKKAESQIKVLSAVEQEVDQEDADSNGVEEMPVDEAEIEDVDLCYTCKKVGHCKINVLTYGKTNHFCDDACFAKFRDGPVEKPGEGAEIVPPSTVMNEIKSADIPAIPRVEFIRKCSQCSTIVNDEDEKTLSWETMDFCSEECLGKYQQELGSHCANCKGNVQPASLGKYCVRFGYEVKQFCCSSCLEEFKKGLKVCSFCQKDISSGAEGFLAPVGDKGTFKDFCTQACMEKYEQMSSNQPPPPQMHPCHVCDNNKLVEVEVFFDSKVNKLCSDICFTAYKFANKLTVDRCDMCRKYFDKDANGEKFNIFYEGVPHNFCCKTCMNVYILAKRKIVPCNWCKVKKYNFDMIKRVQNTGQVLMMCSLNCLTLYHVSVNAVSSRRIKCDMCLQITQAQYHLTMSDATIRNFCTYPCVMNFQQQYSKSPIMLPGKDAPPIPTGTPVPVISSVTSLSNGQPAVNNATSALTTKVASGKLNLVARMMEPPACRNKKTQTRPIMNTKSVSCRPHSASVSVQTDEEKKQPCLIPIPVPIYVPCPMAMYSLPFPMPVPFPLPIPVPVFLPTTRNSIKGIMKEIKRIQEKVPADPFEAELLMMAEMVANEKKDVVTSSDSETENEPTPCDTRPESDGEDDFSPEAIETSNAFGDDIMQIALKMATELDEPAVDLETQLTPATILNQNQTENEADAGSSETSTKKSETGEIRSRKRSLAKSPQKSESSEKKRKKPNTDPVKVTTQSVLSVEEPKPDANMKLKYTFGVNAWKSWVTQKNAEIEKLSNTNKKLKPFKTDILQLTVDELNYSLCLFVKEVKKPNGTQYAPDTIYYLCLGIQQYLFENGRIDNIFTDAYFETFTDCLDEVAKKFTELFTDHHYIVTRVEEEHLWESKQLGAHSPHVLLTTLMFFNTKHFNLTNVEEHIMLSFSHIMKHWKRNPNQQTSTTGTGKAPGSRNILLRFYPPQSVLDDPNSKKKKVYEQQEDEENPLRCPVKLYEFYMSKCPESVKLRNDVFYLQPERSCVPDSPVWYSTMALSKEPLEKMLNRVKMVKEINIALLMP